jgi:hypothetical protein
MLKAMKILTVAVVAGAFAVTGAMAQHEHGKTEGMQKSEMHKDMDGKSKEVTMKGEILDLYCFMNHPDDGQGEGHAKCAKACINKGLPIGFLSNGEVYLITGKEHEPVASMVADYAGKQSTIKGKVITHHGMKAIDLISIEPAK